MSSAQWKRAVTPAVVGGAALATVAAVAFTTAVPQVVSREKVELTATITPGSATNWNADGIDRFYGVNWNETYGPTVIAPFRLVQFWQGAENIINALDAAQTDGAPDVVVSSGRGAGNASAVISYLAANNPDDPRLTDTLWILDNNVDRPNGGYAARYPFFALVGVNPVPVPNNLEGVQILDVGYEYAWNSSAPTYISNLPALLNAIIAYAYRYRQQEKLPVPAEILDPETGKLVEGASGHYIIGTDGQIVRHEPTPDGVTTVYVTYEAKGLPMLQPIRDFGGDLGNAFADIVEPVLTVLVNASYTDNNPLSDPSVYTPMQLFAPPKVWATAAEQLPGALAEGWDKLQQHLGLTSSDQPTTLVAAAEASETGRVDNTTTTATQAASGGTQGSDDEKSHSSRRQSRSERTLEKAADAGEKDTKDTKDTEDTKDHDTKDHQTEDESDTTESSTDDGGSDSGKDTGSSAEKDSDGGVEKDKPAGE
jgi:hypothetical protein